MERINVETSDQPCLNDKTPRRFNRGEKKKKKDKSSFPWGQYGALEDFRDLRTIREKGLLHFGVELLFDLMQVRSLFSWAQTEIS